MSTRRPARTTSSRSRTTARPTVPTATTSATRSRSPGRPATWITCRSRSPRSAPTEVATYTLDLYKNDGPVDPNSGLNQPGTLIAEFKTRASNVPLPGNGGYGVDWYFGPILVPDSLTAIVSSSYSTTTPGQFMGPFADVTNPLVGGALDTIWYGDGTPGNWTANNTWAINDGAATNYLDMTFLAAQSVPEPSSLCLLALGACGGLVVMVRRHRAGPQW